MSGRMPERMDLDRVSAGPILAGLVLAEALAVLALLPGWWLLALLLHGAAISIALRWLPPAGRGTWSGAVLRLIAATLPALGPAAVLGGLLALAFGAARRHAAGPLPEDPIEARLAAISAVRDLPDGLLLEALGDVLRWGSLAQKICALDLAASGLRPGGEALLRLALADPDPLLRAHAEALRPTAERRLLDQAEALRQGVRGAEGRRRLARHLDRAAWSDLMDPARGRAFRAEAVQIWRELAEAAEDPEAVAALGRDLLALGDLPGARATLEAALAHRQASEPVLGWLAECHFRARDYAALDALVGRWAPLLEETAAGHARLSAPWRLWLQAAR